jgi:hypothetical protein
MRSPAFVGKKVDKDRHNFRSAASITLMSVSPEPPQRLAEILQEILALSKQARTSQSESASGSDLAYRVEEHSQRRVEEDNNRQTP